MSGWAEQGATSCRAWLSWRLGWSYNRADERLRVARALGRFKVIDDALSRGLLSYSKVRAITRVATLETEENLVYMARTMTAGQLDGLCSQYRKLTGRYALRDRDRDREAELADLAERADALEQALRENPSPELSDRVYRAQVAVALASAEPNWVAVAQEMEIEVREHVVELGLKRRSLDCGRVKIQAVVEADQAAVLWKGLKALQRDASDPSAGGSSECDDRTSGSASLSKVEALVGLAEAYLGSREQTSHVPGRFEVLVHVNAETLLGQDGVGTLEDGNTIPASTARRLACDNPVVRVLLDAKGVPLDVGRRTRAISPGMRRALLVRDKQRCRFPGCEHRFFLEGHHVQPWTKGGKTCLANLVTLCRKHHELVEPGGGGWSVEASAVGFVFCDPAGERVEEVPSPIVDPGSAEDLIRQNVERGAEIVRESNLPLMWRRTMDRRQAMEALMDHRLQAPLDPLAAPEIFHGRLAS